MNSNERLVVRKLARAAAPLEVSAKGSHRRIHSHQVDWHTARALRQAGLVRIFELRGSRVVELTDAGWLAAEDLVMGVEP